MVSKIHPINSHKKFSGADVREAASKMLAQELTAMKNAPLTPAEQRQVDLMATNISYETLREMGLV